MNEYELRFDIEHSTEDCYDIYDIYTNDEEILSYLIIDRREQVVELHFTLTEEEKQYRVDVDLEVWELTVTEMLEIIDKYKEELNIDSYEIKKA